YFKNHLRRTETKRRRSSPQKNNEFPYCSPPGFGTDFLLSRRKTPDQKKSILDHQVHGYQPGLIRIKFDDQKVSTQPPYRLGITREDKQSAHEQQRTNQKRILNQTGIKTILRTCGFNPSIS